LAKAVWPEARGGVSDEMIDVNISRLRRKLKDNARNPRYIQTVTGQGFILHKAAYANANGAARGGYDDRT
jgi:DNA-binding winged helix-turn-helix (wHTH) protein